LVICMNGLVITYFRILIPESWILIPDYIVWLWIYDTVWTLKCKQSEFLITNSKILENEKFEGFWTISWSGTWAGTTLWPRPAQRASTTHLTGLVPCLGLATSPSGGHGMARDLNMPGRGPFKKARAAPGWYGLNFRTSSWLMKFKIFSG
jgi:hypothetical protein